MQKGGHAVKSPPFCREDHGNPSISIDIPIDRFESDMEVTKFN
jgi:hypothetical protein